MPSAPLPSPELRTGRRGSIASLAVLLLGCLDFDFLRTLRRREDELGVGWLGREFPVRKLGDEARLVRQGAIGDDQAPWHGAILLLLLHPQFELDIRRLLEEQVTA